MSRRTVTWLIDDIDSSEYAPGQGARTVEFALDGVDYELDLGPENIAKLAASLAPFAAKARLTSAAPARRQHRRTRPLAGALAPAEPPSMPPVVNVPSVEQPPAEAAPAPAPQPAPPAVPDLAPPAEPEPVAPAEPSGSAGAAREPLGQAPEDQLDAELLAELAGYDDEFDDDEVDDESPEPAVAEPPAAEVVQASATPAQPGELTPVAQLDPKPYKCSEPGCTWPGSHAPQGKSSHERLAHGIGKGGIRTVTKKLGELVELADARARINLARTDAIEPGVNVYPAEGPRTSGPLVSRTAPVPDGFVPTDWETVADIDGAAVKLRDLCRHGLPEGVRFTYREDVLAVDGIQFETVETTLRNPERVEVAPETGIKHYPILRFHRGDAITVLGLRSPNQPAIIAAYHGSLLAHDTYRTNVERRGGGGARSVSGLPRTPKALVDRLRKLGAVIDDSAGSAIAAVTFQGNDLGKISVGERTQRETVESDYQRTVRRMEAISRRAG